MKLSHYYSSQVYEALARLVLFEGDLEGTLRSIIQPYESFTIPKGNGGPGRSIEAPEQRLKDLQGRVLRQLLYKVPVSPACHGFVPGRSIVTHARLHRNQRELLNFDIADAFPSVTRHRVVDALRRRLGTFLKHRVPRFDRKLRDELVELIADLCTYEDHLPQGAPTSGALLNMVLAPMDRRLHKEIRRWGKKSYRGLVYSRYADDLNLSSPDDLPPDAEKVMRSAIHQAGFRFNPRKTRRADKALGQPLMVCGIQVDGEQLRLPRKVLKRYRAVLHKSFYEGTLSEHRRGEIFGIVGLVSMVYGRLPRLLQEPWRLLAAKHGLSGPSDEFAESVSGYQKS